MIEQKKSLSDLAVRLRVLRYSEKKAYLMELDEHAQDYYMQISSGKQLNPFLFQPLAFSLYYSLEGRPYVQPEFPSQMTMKDLNARKRFNALFSGVVAYTRASDDEKRNFKRSALKTADPLSKIGYLIKMRQNGLS